MMIGSRNFSEHKMKRSLYDSLRKQRQLSNRINVLLQEKEKKLKVIERRITLTHQEQEIRVEKSRKRQKIMKGLSQQQQSFENGKKGEISNNSLFRQLRQELNSSIHFKQSELQQTRRHWYNQMKKMQDDNHEKIMKKRQFQLQLNKKKKKQVKLMEINSKENIKKYWDERVDCILEKKWEEQERKNRIYEDSLNSISILQEREKKLVDQIKNTVEYQKKLKTQPYQVAYIDERPTITWRMGQKDI